MAKSIERLLLCAIMFQYYYEQGVEPNCNFMNQVLGSFVKMYPNPQCFILLKYKLKLNRAIYETKPNPNGIKKYLNKTVRYVTLHHIYNSIYRYVNLKVSSLLIFFNFEFLKSSV